MSHFYVTGADFQHGITIAAADVTGDGKAEIAVRAGPGGAPRVHVYDPLTGTTIAGPLGSFLAFDSGFHGGVSLGADALAGDVDADGTPDLAVGTGPGTAPLVRVFSGATGDELLELSPFDSGATGGVQVGLAYINDDAYADVVVGSGPGITAAIQVFDGQSGEQLAGDVGEYTPFGESTGGVDVAASNDPPGFGYSDVVISQLYSGGGAPGATYNQDFIELFNHSGATVNLSGWSVQYTSATGTIWQVTPLSGALSPGQYYLIGEAVGGSGVSLPTPDASGTIAMDPTSGKVALVHSVTPLTGSPTFSPLIADFVGYGSADYYEGSAPAPSPFPSTTQADYRLLDGFQDTDDNANDFGVSAVGPRNTSYSPPVSPPPPPAPASIGDHVWYDSNHNGTPDGGESDAAAIDVTLTGGGLTASLTATTDASGNYTFTGLAAGVYTLHFSPPLGYDVDAPGASGSSIFD